MSCCRIELNAPQREAVEHPGGPLLVFAGAGSGKTAMLTHRVVHLVRELGVEPSHILAVTFTNKATKEMRDRIEAMIGDAGRRVTVSTFHALGAQMLRSLAGATSRKFNFVIYDEADQMTVIRQIMAERQIDKKMFKPSELLSQITKAKERGFSPDDLPEIDLLASTAKAVWERYERYLERANAWDFEDLLLVPMRLAEGTGGAAERIRTRYQHVLVDEFQDTSHTQYRLVRAMTAESRNLTVVGDDDQCHPEGTRIATVHGESSTPIERMREGDLVRTVDTTTGTLGFRGKVLGVASRPYEGQVFRFKMLGSAVDVTPEHRMLVREEERSEIIVMTAQRLASLTSKPWYVPGLVDLSRVKRGERSVVWKPLQRVEVGTYKGPVYSLEVDRDHTYFADHIGVHNCIYGWRSADVSIIRGFAKDFPDAKVVKLEENYRSTGHIVKAALGVIETSYARVPKSLWTSADKGAKVSLVECGSDRDEGRFIGKTIANEHAKGTPLGAFAVLYRTHQVARAIEEPLRDAGIPYVVVGGPRFYDRKEIRDVMSYFRLACNPDSQIDLLRAIQSPSRGIGPAKVARIVEIARERQTSLLGAIRYLLPTGELRPKEHAALEAFEELFFQANRFRSNQKPPSEIAKHVLESSGYHAMWLAEAARQKKEGDVEAEMDAEQRAANVLEILSAIGSYETEKGPSATLEGYLERVALMSHQDDLVGGKVNLMTVHAAKGLEFPWVFVAGCEEGVLPIRAEPAHELDEERRLMYVAITRARERLFLTRANFRYMRGEARCNAPSRFLSAIADDAKEKVIG